MTEFWEVRQAFIGNSSRVINVDALVNTAGMSPALIRGVVSGAMIPSSDGTITACRNNQSGALRIIDAEAGQTCKASETQLTWKDAIHGKVADSDKLDGQDSTAFLGATQKAADSDKLDGLDATNLLPDGDLPAGTTLRGRYDIYGNSTGSSEEFGADGISYVYTFRSLPQAHFIPLGTTPPPECPGMPGSPEAQPGHLCVYEQDRENIAPGYPTFYVQDTYGFGIWAGPLTVGHFRSYGTWAVTAPPTRLW